MEPLTSFGIGIGVSIVSTAAQSLWKNSAPLPEIQALKRVFGRAFECVITDLASDRERDVQLHIQSLLEEFFRDPDVACPVLRRVIAGDRLPVTDLGKRFDAIGFDTGSLPIPFDILMRSLFDNLANLLEKEMQNPVSALRKLINSERLRSIQNASHEIASDLRDVKESVYAVRHVIMTARAAEQSEHMILQGQIASLAASIPGAGPEIADRVSIAQSCLNNFDDRGAESILLDIRGRSWQYCSTDQQSKILQLLARISELRGDTFTAAQHYREAATATDNRLLSTLYEAYALVMEGNRAEAYQLAEDALDSASRDERVWNLLVQTAPPEIAFETIEARVPTELLSSADVATGLSALARAREEHDAAERYARAALTASPESPLTNLFCGIAILVRLEGQLPHMHASPDLRARLEEAEGMFRQAMKLLGDRPPRQLEEFIRANRANVLCMLERDTEAIEELAVLQDVNPESSKYPLELARLLANTENYRRARDILARYATRRHSDRIAAMQLECYRSDQGASLSDAAEIARAALLQPYDDSFGRLILLHGCIHLLQGGADLSVEDITSDIEQLPPLEKEAAQAELYLVKGDLREAQSAAVRAKELALQELDHDKSRYVAYLLERCGLHPLAIEVWPTIISFDALTRDTLSFLSCCQTAGSLVDIRATCQRLRARGIFHPELFDSEARVLASIGAYYDLLKLVQEYQDQEWDQGFRKYLNLQLCQLSTQLDKPELFVQDLEELPSAETVTPVLGEAMIKLLYHHGRIAEGQRFAYALHRRFPDSVEAHRGIVSILLASGAKPDIKSEVGPGCVVHYTTEEGGEGYLILEDEFDPIKSQNELGPQDTRYSELLGKKKGEEFLLLRSQVQERVARITSIVSKHEHLFSEAVSKIGVMFGPAAGIEPFSIGISGDPRKALEPILKQLENRKSVREEIFQFYSSNPMPLSMLARFIGVGIPRLVLSLYADTGTRIYSAEGNEREQILALRGLSSSECLVLDTSAISTLIACDALDLLDALDHRLLIGENVLHDLNEEIRECNERDGQYGVLYQTEHGPRFEKVEPGADEQWRQKLVEARDTLATRCHVEGGSITLKLPREFQATIGVTLPRSSIEALALLTERDAVLWTDDLRLGYLARDVFGGALPGRRVWTRLLAQERVGKDRYSSQKLVALTARLMQLGFTNLPGISDQEFLYMLRDGGFSKGHPAVQFLLKWISESMENTRRAVSLSAIVLKLTWQYCENDEARINLVDAVLTALAESSHDDVLTMLLNVLPSAFGVDLITAEKCAEGIRNWKRAQQIGNV